MKKCPFCGAELNDDNLFCTECGKELSKGIVCQHCGASVNEGDAFCTECGKRVDEVPQATSSEPTKPKCPHCGAPMNEGDAFCMQCGKKVDELQPTETEEVIATKECIKEASDGNIIETPQMEEQEEVEYHYDIEEEPKTWRDYKLPIFGGIFLVLFLGACWWYYDSSNKRVAMEKAIADSLEVVRQDSIHKADSLKNIKLQEAEKEQQIASCKAFLEKFYNGLDKAVDKNEYIRKHVTHKAQEFLRKEYDYYSESDSMAIWIFSTDLIGPMNRTIEVVDDNTYKVITTAEDYEKEVVIGIIKEGNFYKIDTIEEGNYVDTRK